MPLTRLHAVWQAFACSLLFICTSFAAAPVVSSFAPTAGTIGNTITITGTGFTGVTAVTFAGVASTFTTVSATKITANVPNTAATGPIAVTTTATGASSASFTVTPGMALSSMSGTPLSSTTISAVGFHAGTAVDLYFDTADTALAVSTPTGTLTTALQIPASAQPGIHWVTYVERGSNLAAQASFNVSTNWPTRGYSSQGRGYNPFENSIDTSNVNSLVTAWSAASGGFANSSPFVYMAGNLYVGDVRGQVRAYSAAGKLLWTASPGLDMEQVTPVANGKRVFFGDSGGNVYAYSLTCRNDGGVCAPMWTANMSATVTGDLVVYKGSLYVPTSDGSIHVLDPNTGASGTAVFGFSASAGAVTTPIAFGADGTFYYGAGSTFEYRTSDGGSGGLPRAGTVSPIAYYNGTAYYTTADGMLHQFGGAGWTAATSGTGCAPAPAIASNRVIAGGCTTLGSYNPKNGSLFWQIATPGAVLGVSIANGVVYACENPGSGFGGVLEAYDLLYASHLWTGGRCTGGGPIIANGNVFAAFATISAYVPANSAGAQGSAMPRPTIQSLRPDIALKPQLSGIERATDQSAE